MTEVLELRKQKIVLEDYDYKKDIQNRIIFSTFSPFDLEVLEEICCLSLSFNFKDLQTNLMVPTTVLEASLKKLEQLNLFTQKGELILVDKNTRKFIESQLELVEEGHSFGMEHLEKLLKKVPIFILPVWYLLPKTATAIFEGIIEKYLKTPQLYYRSIQSLQFEDELLQKIKEKLLLSKEYTLYFNELKEAFQIDDEELHKAFLLLEFHMVGILHYQKDKAEIKQTFTLYPELKKYLVFLQKNRPSSMKEELKIWRKESFAFVKDLASLLHLIKDHSLEVKKGALFLELQKDSFSHVEKALKLDPECAESYLHQLVTKAVLFNLAVVQGDILSLGDCEHFLNKTLEDRAIFAFRHPKNTLLIFNGPKAMLNEKNVRECEKSINSVLDLGWVDFEDFFNILTIGINGRPPVQLCKIGKRYTYQYPNYDLVEKELIKATLFEHLFQAGLINCGVHKNRQCFIVTEFGKSVFGN